MKFLNVDYSHSFAATGTLEGQYFRKTGKLISLSEQNLIDCSQQNKGCKTGYPGPALMDIQSQGGIETESSYPYEARKGECRFDETKIGARVTGVKRTEKYNEIELMEEVASVGPIAVFIDASRLRSYKGGVYYDTKCSNVDKILNHAALVVGYGTDKESGLDYWLVKNSWSSGWGEQGYVRMARNKNNHCGIASNPVYPTV